MDVILARHRLMVGLRDLPSSIIVTRKELRDTFLSLRAYLMATIAFIGISFFMWVQTEIPMGTNPIVEMIVALLSLLGLFFAVTFSMDAIVSEKTLRTLPLVRSSPISSSSVVVGKYMAIILTWIAILGASVSYFILGGKGLVGHVDWGNLALGYLSTVLVVSAVGSLAIFISSVSSSVKSSALGSLGILFAFMGISVARQLFAGFQSVLDILNFLRNFSVIRYSSMVTEQLFQSGGDAWWGVAGLLAYTVVFIIAAICVLGLKEGDLP
jgi:ABC-2 type transport system permease protein